MLSAVNPSPATSVCLDQAFVAGRGVVTVGRVEQNLMSAIRMDGASPQPLPEKLVNMVSRQHARLEVVDGHIQLRDLGPVNGTYVNDQRMEPSSTRVLQEDDVVSFGGPSTIALRGQSRPNPWVWRVRQLHQFLASYVPPGQGPPASPSVPAGGSGGQQAAAEEAARDVYRFSPGPPVLPQQPAEQQQAEQQAAAEVASPRSPEDAALRAGAGSKEEEEAIVSPEPAPGGSALPGSMPVQQQPEPPAAAAEAASPGVAAEAGAAGAAEERVEESDDSAALDLAAMEAYEAHLATQQPCSGQGSAPAETQAAGGAGGHPPAAVQAAPLPPGMLPTQAATQQLPPGELPVRPAVHRVQPGLAHFQGAAQPLPPGAMPVQGATRLLPPGAMPVQGAPQPLPPGAMPVQGATQLLPPGAMPVQGVPQPLPPGAMPVQGTTQLLPPGAVPLQGATHSFFGMAASAPPAAAAAAAPPAAGILRGSMPRRPPALQMPRPRPAAEPELVDLTADSPSPSPQAAGRQRGAPGGAHGARPSWAQVAGAAGGASWGGAAAGAEFVDLAGSPSKRRHGAAQEVEQESKRARPSPEAHLQHHGAAGTSHAAAAAGTSAAAGAAAAAAAAGAVPSTAAAAAAAGPDLSGMHQELMCAICQEMLVATHSMYPCNHSFCGECLAGWLGKGKRECPTCRVKAAGAPVRAHQMDNIISMVALSLAPDDKESRQEKVASWEANRERLEKELASPWGRGGGGSGRSGVGRGADMMAALAATLLGAGPLGGFGGFSGGLMAGGDPLGLEPEPHWAPGGAGGRRRGAAVPQRALAPAAPIRNEFRTEVSPASGNARCERCAAGIGENVTRIGMRPLGRQRGGSGGFHWYHLSCLHTAHWREAATEGVQNLRHIPARDQAYVRERMRPAR